MPPGVPGRALQYVVLTPCSRPLRWGRRSESAPSGRSRPDELRVGEDKNSKLPVRSQGGRRLAGGEGRGGAAALGECGCGLFRVPGERGSRRCRGS